MGRQFIGTCGGRGKLYGCKVCYTYISSHHQLTSPHFNGSTGPAMLFKCAWNIEHGEVERRKMTTGWHIVRDVFCIECKNKLGWMYEMAIEEQQKYKEGQIILENALICKISDGIRDPLGEDDDDKMPEPNIEQPPRTRSPSESSQNSRSNSESGSSGF